MKNHKKDIIQFLTWMRNGTAFCTTWFLILILVYNSFFGIQNIQTESLIKMVLWIVGAVFLFNLFLSVFIIKKWRFIKRLSCFMVSISLYECLGFYWIGLWSESGTAMEWLTFIGVILALYFVCIAIYQQYSKRKETIYTEALQEYQKQRSIENGR